MNGWSVTIDLKLNYGLRAISGQLRYFMWAALLFIKSKDKLKMEVSTDRLLVRGMAMSNVTMATLAVLI
jgi:hypothetical protein